MFNFFKKKPIVLECLTSNPIVYKCFKLKPAFNYYPDWWKKLPKYSEKDRRVPLTMKGCSGFLELYKHSFVLPLWSDVRIELKNSNIVYDNNEQKKEIEITSGDENNLEWEIHPIKQHSGYLDDKNEIIIKFYTEWKFKCDEDINFLVSDCVYNRNENSKFSTLNGIVSFKYQYSNNTFLKVNKSNLPMFLAADTPLCFLTPLTERPIKLVYRFISSEEHNSLDAAHFSFSNKFYNLKRMIKKYERI